MASLAEMLGLQSALAITQAQDERARQLTQQGAPLTEILQTLQGSPMLGFGAGVTKGPGPLLQLLMRGQPTGIARATRMQPKIAGRHEVRKFELPDKPTVARGKLSEKELFARAVNKQKTKQENVESALIEARRRLLGESLKMVVKPEVEEKLAIEGGRLYSSLRGDFVVEDFVGGSSFGGPGIVERFATLEAAEQFVLDNFPLKR